MSFLSFQMAKNDSNQSNWDMSVAFITFITIPAIKFDKNLSDGSSLFQMIQGPIYN